MKRELKLLDFAKMKFDIVIAAGQSNCEGCGIGDVEFPFEPKPNIWYMNRNFTISQATEKVRGNLLQGTFKLSFAEEYIKNGQLPCDRHIIIIDCAMGATGFEEGMWGKNEPLTLDMIDMTKTVLQLNDDNRVVAFLWHQGERSINFNLDVNFHSKSLHIMIDEIISCFGANYPFIAGDFVPSWKKTKGKQGALIADAIREVFCNGYNGGFVDTNGLVSNCEAVEGSIDDIHFSRDSCYKLGVRYYEKFNELITK